MTQYQRIANALRQGKCTHMELIHKTGSTCVWKRIAEMRARGWKIMQGWRECSGRKLRVYWIDNGYCENCGDPNPPGRARKYCCTACRAKAYRGR